MPMDTIVSDLISEDKEIKELLRNKIIALIKDIKFSADTKKSIEKSIASELGNYMDDIVCDCLEDIQDKFKEVITKNLPTLFSKLK